MAGAAALLLAASGAHALKPHDGGTGGGGGRGVSLPAPPTAVSNPKWQAPNPTGLARAIGGAKEPRTTSTEREQLEKEKWDQRKSE